MQRRWRFNGDENIYDYVNLYDSIPVVLEKLRWSWGKSFIGNDQLNKSALHSIPSDSFLPIVIDNKNGDKVLTVYCNVKPDTRTSSAIDYNNFVAFKIDSSTPKIYLGKVTVSLSLTMKMILMVVRIF